MLDRISHFLAQLRGLPIMIGVGLVVLNLILQFINVPVIEVIADANVFMHLGIIVGLIGVMLSEALGAW